MEIVAQIRDNPSQLPRVYLRSCSEKSGTEVASAIAQGAASDNYSTASSSSSKEGQRPKVGDDNVASGINAASLPMESTSSISSDPVMLSKPGVTTSDVQLSWPSTTSSSKHSDPKPPSTNAPTNRFIVSQASTESSESTSEARRIGRFQIVQSSPIEEPVVDPMPDNNDQANNIEPFQVAGHDDRPEEDGERPSSSSSASGTTSSTLPSFSNGYAATTDRSNASSTTASLTDANYSGSALSSNRPTPISPPALEGAAALPQLEAPPTPALPKNYEDMTTCQLMAAMQNLDLKYYDQMEQMNRRIQEENTNYYTERNALTLQYIMMSKATHSEAAGPQQQQQQHIPGIDELRRIVRQTIPPPIATLPIVFPQLLSAAVVRPIVPAMQPQVPLLQHPFGPQQLQLLGPPLPLSRPEAAPDSMQPLLPQLQPVPLANENEEEAAENEIADQSDKDDDAIQLPDSTEADYK